MMNRCLLIVCCFLLSTFLAQAQQQLDAVPLSSYPDELSTTTLPMDSNTLPFTSYMPTQADAYTAPFAIMAEVDDDVDDFQVSGGKKGGFGIGIPLGVGFGFGGKKGFGGGLGYGGGFGLGYGGGLGFGGPFGGVGWGKGLYGGGFGGFPGFGLGGGFGGGLLGGGYGGFGGYGGGKKGGYGGGLGFGGGYGW